MTKDMFFEAKHLRCPVCGKFMAFEAPEEECGQTLVYQDGAWDPGDPPEWAACHKKCAGEEQERRCR